MYRLPSSLTSPGAAATLYSLKSSPLVIFGTCTTARECSRTGTSCWGASGRRLLSGERGVLGLSIASVGLALDRAADHGRRASCGSCHDQITPSRYAIFVHFVSIQGAYRSFLTLCTPVSDKCQSRDSHIPGEVSSQEYPKPTPSIRHEGCLSLPYKGFASVSPTAGYQAVIKFVSFRAYDSSFSSLIGTFTQVCPILGERN